jgi:hypothetical protein
MINRKELDEIMLSFPQGVPVEVIRPWQHGESETVEKIWGCLVGAVLTEGSTPEVLGLSIRRRKTASWLDKPVTHRLLYDASRKKQMSPDALKQLAETRIKRNQNECIRIVYMFIIHLPL